MKEINRTVLPFRENNEWKRGTPDSLCWQGDSLVDWVGGGARYNPDGSYSSGGISYGYTFDHAVTSTNGRYSAIVTRLGTKAVILKDGKIVREINRSFENAEAYEYPMTFFDLPDGRTAIAHCPDNYGKLEIEEAESGKRLTERSSKPPDFFHSRLAVSLDNRYLISAGWHWHPLDDVWIYELERVLEQPELLDEDPSSNYPISLPFESDVSATFTETGLLIVATSNNNYDHKGVDSEKQKPARRSSIGVYDLHSKTYCSQAQMEEPAGTLLPLEDDFAIGFYEHPKLIELKTGLVLHKWEELNSGKQLSSIIWGLEEKLPPLALDPINKRFAVASEEAITIIQLG